MNEIIFLVEESPEGGYTARGLGHSIFTEADTWEELKEAVRCHFERYHPRPFSLESCFCGLTNNTVAQW